MPRKGIPDGMADGTSYMGTGTERQAGWHWQSGSMRSQGIGLGRISVSSTVCPAAHLHACAGHSPASDEGRCANYPWHRNRRPARFELHCTWLPYLSTCRTASAATHQSCGLPDTRLGCTRLADTTGFISVFAVVCSWPPVRTSTLQPSRPTKVRTHSSSTAAFNAARITWRCCATQ